MLTSAKHPYLRTVPPSRACLLLLRVSFELKFSELKCKCCNATPTHADAQPCQRTPHHGYTTPAVILTIRFTSVESLSRCFFYHCLSALVPEGNGGVLCSFCGCYIPFPLVGMPFTLMDSVFALVRELPFFLFSLVFVLLVLVHGCVDYICEAHVEIHLHVDVNDWLASLHSPVVYWHGGPYTSHSG